MKFGIRQAYRLITPLKFNTFTNRKSEIKMLNQVKSCNAGKKLIVLFFAIAVLFPFSSCNKAGIGGKAIVVAIPKHHDEHIYGATAYVKFDTDTEPADPINDYDLIVAGEAGEDHVHIEELQPGQYFIYCVGFDSIEAVTVKGGAAIKIKGSQKEDEIDLEIAVAE